MDNNCLETSIAASFQWPEPLIIDVICEQYRDIVNPTDRLRIAKLQQQVLHLLFEGDVMRSTARRLELFAYCVARGVAADRIAKADRAVFRELISLAAIQFRTSPRRRAAISSKLHVALGRLALPAEPAVKPAYLPLRPRRMISAQAA